MDLSSSLGRNPRHAETQGTPREFEARCPPTGLPLRQTVWKTHLGVLCLTSGTLGRRVPGAPKTTTNLWRLALASAQHSSPHTPEHAPAASAARHLGPERTLAPSCGHLL